MIQNEIPVLFMETAEAEATKLFVNTCLAHRVSCFNYDPALKEYRLGQMQAELAAAGQSTAPVGQLRSQYQSAKASQKAAYLAMARGA